MDSEADLKRLLAEATAKLNRVEDERAILDTLHEYHHAIGNHEREAWLDCFTEDGVFASCKPDGTSVFELRGRTERAAWFDKRAPKWPAGSEAHAYTNPRITVEGDQAKASGFFITMKMDGGTLILRSTGHYADRLVRSADGKWRIKERRASTRMTNRTSFDA